MILDSQEQKDTLLALLRLAPISGTYSQVKPIADRVAQLIHDVEKAHVEVSNDGITKNISKIRS
jgi:hypothetical protein